MLGNPDHAVGGLAVRRPAGVELRPLGRGDIAQAVGMAREQRDLSPLPDAGSVRERWERLVNSADAVPYLASADGDPAGFVMLAFRRRLNFATFEGWLSDLYVRPPFRGRGIGRMLVEAAVAEWRLRQGHRVTVEVPLQAAPARATLEALGFIESMIDFRIPLPAGSSPMAEAPNGVSIRPLAESDFDAVTRLIAEFGPHRSPVPDRMAAVRRTFAGHARAVAAGDAGSIVADVEGTTIGVCILEWRDAFWDTGRSAWIPDLVVTEPMRDRGIGRALLAAGLQRAGAAGATEARIESGQGRVTAHRLFATVGFETTGSTFILEREN